MSPDCATCIGNEIGVLIEPKGDWAVARACPECVESCTACRGERTFLRTDEAGYQYLVACTCQQKIDAVERYNAARIPARYAHCSVRNFDAKGGNQRSVQQQVHHHLEGSHPHGKGLLFAGEVGVGKSHLLVAALRLLALERGTPVRFVEFTHLLAEIKEGFSRGRGEADVIGPAATIRVLGIDELGKGLGTEWQNAMLDELISRRYNQRLTTFFTTNLPLSAPDKSDAKNSKAFEAVTLADRVGPRIYSRLFEMCEFLEVTGPDARRL